MKKIDLQKSTDLFKSALAKTAEVSKNAAEAVKAKSQELSEQNQIRSYEARMKKYNPLFPDVFNSDSFKMPTLIVIVDSNVRKGIDVCEGAMGWLSTEKDVEILHLYDTYLDNCSTRFLPTPQCNAVYFVDPHNKDIFVNTDCYFSNMHEEKLAELQHIAYSLGAKSYSVEVEESTNEASSTKGKADMKFKKIINASASEEYSESSRSKVKAMAHANFNSGRDPVMPKLCWYANDNNVRNLIEMRCSGHDMGITDYTIELNSSNSATMSLNTAAKVDAAIISLGMNCNFSNKGEKEHNRKMIFKLEF